VGVDVAADRGDGGNAGEFGENGGVAYVAGVEDVIDAGEGGKEFGAEEAVGVGEDADEHLVALAETGAGVEVVAEAVADEVEGEDAEG